jgi:hypothetical protein
MRLIDGFIAAADQCHDAVPPALALSLVATQARGCCISPALAMIETRGERTQPALSVKKCLMVALAYLM